MPMDALGLDTGLLQATRDPAAGIEPYIPIARPLAIAPGQIWLVEWRPDRQADSRERALIAAVDVVIYDPGLSDVMAAALPLGIYGEPASAIASDTPGAERCARFARDGWRVVRIVAGNAGAVAARLLAAGMLRIDGPSGGASPVAVFSAPAIAAPTRAIVANGLAG